MVPEARLNFNRPGLRFLHLASGVRSASPVPLRDVAVRSRRPRAAVDPAWPVLFHWCECLVMIKVKAAHVVQPPFDSDGTSFGRTIHFLSNENLSMHWKIRGTCLAGCVSAIARVAVCAQPVPAQLPPPSGPSYGGSVPSSRELVSGIAWYGVLKDGLAEAKRTGKPILFITAAAQCRGVPGMW